MPNRRVPPEAPLPSPAELAGDNGVVMILGELRGQFREMIHTMNNMAMKVDGLSSIVLKSEGVPETLKAHEGRIAALEAVSLTRATIPALVADHDARLKVIEKTEIKREGVVSFGTWLFRSPIIGWIVSTISAIGATLFLMKGH